MTTGFQINGVDWDDKFVRRDKFTQGGLWIWGGQVGLGAASFGQLGTNDIVHRSSPVQTIAGGTNWIQISGGLASAAAIKTDGTLWLWGRNTDGELGNNTATNRSSPVQTVSGGNNWKYISLGTYSSYSIKTDGTLWAWGVNNFGQLGTNDIVHRSSPIQTVAGGTNWKLISAGSRHAAAIKTDNSLWLWGRNNSGALGDNTITHRSSPVQTISGGTNWKAVSSGALHTAAIKADGTLWLWGENSSGELGTNNTINRSSPIQTISGGTDWRVVACGDYNTNSIKTNGTLWTWGWNRDGQLGTNDIVHRSSPVQTISGGTNWKLISAGGYTISAIKTDGTLWLWGRNRNGQLGTNDIVHRSSPVQTVAGGTNWKLVGCGDYHTGGIREDYY